MASVLTRNYIMSFLSYSMYGFKGKLRLSTSVSIIYRHLYDRKLWQGDETSTPLFKRCVMWSRTSTSAISALPVCLKTGEMFVFTNRK